MKTDNEVVVTGRTVGGERDEVAGHRHGRAMKSLAGRRTVGRRTVSPVAREKRLERDRDGHTVDRNWLVDKGK